MVGKVGKVRGFLTTEYTEYTEKVWLDDDTANRDTWIMAEIHK